jgi:hypothetical protein
MDLWRSFLVWCLTQQHGGPCGVLASIQAELLKILLFGPRTVHPLSMISIDFPTHLTNEFTKAPLDMSRQKMRQALALSMGIILARCSLMPAATLQDDTTVENESNDNDNDNQSVSEATVRIVLPKHELWDTTTCLDWQHLEPWNSHDEGEGLSKNLLTYTISLNRNIPSGETALKRQKRSGEEIDNDNNNDNDFDHLVTELAHATAQFLLETNSLNWFQRPGGVLLMVMSIAFSRGIPKTQGDMDDLTAKLTSNFGHCSQELINVLLTGQAGTCVCVCTCVYVYIYIYIYIYGTMERWNFRKIRSRVYTLISHVFFFNFMFLPMHMPKNALKKKFPTCLIIRFDLREN